jgi:hypothetical protein
LVKEEKHEKMRLRDVFDRRKQQGKKELGLQKAKVLYDEKYTYVNPIEEIIERSGAAVAFYERQRLANKVVGLYKDIQGRKMRPVMGEQDFSMSALDSYLDNMQDFQFNKINSLPGGFQPENSIRIYNNGKVEYWSAPPDVVKALSGLLPKEWGRAMKLFQMSAHALRLGATSTPKFFLRNTRRDPLTQFLYTKEGGVPLWDTMLGLAHYLRRDDVWEEFTRSGMGHATQSTLDADFAALQGITYKALVSGNQRKFRGSDKFLHRGIKNKSVTDIAKGTALIPYEMARHLGEMGETATRIGHFNRLRLMSEGKGALSKPLELFNTYTLGLEKAGWVAVKNRSLRAGRAEFKKFKNRKFEYLDMLKAVREGTVDFHRMGDLVRTYNNIRAFTNAGLQDFDILARTMKDRPFTTMLRATLALGIPSWYFYNKWKDDEDYQKEPDYKRNMFWYVDKDEDGEWIRWPKPFLPGVVFGTLTERFVEHAYKTDQGLYESLTNDFFGSDEAESFLKGAMNTAPTEIIGGAKWLDAAPGGQPFDLMSSLTSALPDAASTYTQLKSNYDDFRERQISPDYLGQGMPGYKFTEKTSPTMVEAGKALPNVINPEVAEWMVSDLLGGTGTMALDIADAITRRTTGRKRDIQKDPVDSVLISLGLKDKGSRGFGSESVRKFYEARKRMTYVNESETQMKRKVDEDELPRNGV